MKKIFKKRKTETLSEWIDRIYISCQELEAIELHDILSEVSKVSYIEGVQTERELNKKYGG